MVGVGAVLLAACGTETNSAPSIPATVATTPPTVAASTTVATEVATTPAPSTSQAAPVTTAPASSTAVAQTTTVPTPDASAHRMVLYGSESGVSWMPVGWWTGSAWESVAWLAEPDSIPPFDIDVVAIASTALIDGPHRNVSAQPATWGCVDDEGLPSLSVADVSIPDDDTGYPSGAIAVTGVGELEPRPVRAVGRDDPTYQAAGEAHVPASATVDPASGDVAQVVRADLDGDSIEEVVYVFERFSESGFGEAGDFTYLVARMPDATGAVTQQVLIDHVISEVPEFPNPLRTRVIAVADLNGDGSMEVVARTETWEATAIEVFEFVDGELVAVMATVCGV